MDANLTLADVVYIILALGGILVTCILWLFTLNYTVKTSKEHIDDLKLRMSNVEGRGAFLEKEMIELKIIVGHIRENFIGVKGDVSEMKTDIKTILTRHINGN